MYDDLKLPLPASSPLRTLITADYTPLPLYVPAGWTVHQNTLMARRLSSGLYEVPDSEDLFWASKDPPEATGQYRTDPTSLWREIHLDAGWYWRRDKNLSCFRLVMLDPDWDHISREHSTTDLDDLMAVLETWLQAITETGTAPPP